MMQDRQLLKWPLVQQLYTRAPTVVNSSTSLSGALPIYDSRLINAYGEVIPGTKGEYQVFKRPGIGGEVLSGYGMPGGSYTYPSPASSGAVLNLYVTNGVLYASETAVSGFSAIPGAPCYFEIIDSNPITVIILVAGGSGGAGLAGSGFLYTPSTNACVPINDATFTSIVRVPGLAFLDGWTFVMDQSGVIWNTNGQSNAAVWNALNTIPANLYGDSGVYLARQLSYVVAMKQWTTQIFYDAGAQVEGEGSPLGLVPDATVPYGCMHPFTVAKIDETLIWVTTNQDLCPQVIVLDNLTPTIVSSPSVERILKNFQAVTGPIEVGGFGSYSTGVYSWGIKIAGHRLYGLTIFALDITLVFDIDQRLWYIWTDPEGGYWPYGYPSYRSPNYVDGVAGAQFVQHLVTGGIYTLDDMYTFPTDNGEIFNVDIYTPTTSFGTLRNKSLNNMYFDSDIIKGNQMFARYTDDDYNSWSNFRTIRLDYERPELDDEGSFIRRAYHFRHAAACPFRLSSAGLDLDIGIL